MPYTNVDIIREKRGKSLEGLEATEFYEEVGLKIIIVDLLINLIQN
jgi:hypothetical protein